MVCHTSLGRLVCDLEDAGKCIPGVNRKHIKRIEPDNRDEKVARKSEFQNTRGACGYGHRDARGRVAEGTGGQWAGERAEMKKKLDPKMARRHERKGQARA